MVGNKLDVDIIGAANAGMKTVLVNSNIDLESEERIIEENIELKVLNNISELNTIL